MGTKVDRVCKAAFSVVGLEGSTARGAGFVQRLWAEANARFAEVEPLAKRDVQGGLAGIWGAMTDFSRSFAPWEDFCRGLYLAGVECEEGAQPPEGWVKWRVPGYEYLCVECDSEDAFSKGLSILKENGLSLVGAAQDFTSPTTGKSSVWFPIRRLDEA